VGALVSLSLLLSTLLSMSAMVKLILGCSMVCYMEKLTTQWEGQICEGEMAE